MTEITVEPATFELVLFDAGMIAADAELALTRVPELTLETLTIAVEENKPTTRMRITSVDPAAVMVESGRLENTKQPRTYSPDAAAITLTKACVELAQRLDPGFGAPDLLDEVSLAERIAWDVQQLGRVQATGVTIHAPRYRYDFRNRHGFTDAVDAAFDRLLTWHDARYADVVALSHALTA